MSLHVGQGHGPSTSPRLALRLSRSAVTVALAAAFLPMALGHGGHEVDKIPEGETISLEPIVCWLHAGAWGAAGVDDVAGHDAMDSHLSPDARLWHPVPARHGSRGEYALLLSGDVMD